MLGDIGLFAVNFKGTVQWSVPLEWRPRRGWGPAASPVLHDGRLFFLNDNDAQSFIAAYDTDSGTELWRTNRDEPSNWATPYIWQHDIRTELITSGTRGVRSYTVDGNLLWQLTGMSSLVIPTPFARNGFLYINSGYVADSNRPVYAIRPGGSGNISLREGSTRQRLRRLVRPTAWVLQSIIAGLRRLLLHPTRPWDLAVPRRQNGTRGLPPAANFGRHAFHRLPMGL